MIALGFCIQSSVTAIRLASKSVKVFGSLKELFQSARASALTACFHFDGYNFLLNLLDIEDRATSVKILSERIGGSQRPVTLRNSFSECYRGILAGTHVSLSLCSDDEVSMAAQWNLVPDEHFFTNIQAPAIHVMNPHR
ncbi:hypothetical protein MRX96_001551 [Rhipicephalus microplus]